MKKITYSLLALTLTACGGGGGGGTPSTGNDTSDPFIHKIGFGQVANMSSDPNLQPVPPKIEGPAGNKINPGQTFLYDKNATPIWDTNDLLATTLKHTFVLKAYLSLDEQISQEDVKLYEYTCVWDFVREPEKQVSTCTSGNQSVTLDKKDFASSDDTTVIIGRPMKGVYAEGNQNTIRSYMEIQRDGEARIEALSTTADISSILTEVPKSAFVIFQGDWINYGTTNNRATSITFY